MSNAFPKQETREAFLESMPGIDPENQKAPFTYVPPSHAHALDPESVLVEGIRGVGKSFWWKALSQETHRRFVASAFPETRLRPDTFIGLGYGEKHTQHESFPSKDVINNLVRQYDPRFIWKAVVATNLQFPNPYPSIGKWGDRTEWVLNHPEEYDDLLFSIDKKIAMEGNRFFILFDALDRLASDWGKLRPIVKALFQLSLDMMSCKAIRLKLFVRSDMIEDKQFFSFPDASKLLAKRASLLWRKVDLFSLMFQCLGNAPTYGQRFRDHIKSEFLLRWEKDSDNVAWMLPEELRRDEKLQKTIFHAITGPAMASGLSGHKRGFPYTWLPNHLADGRDQVSPRSFFSALRTAAEGVYDIPTAEWPYSLHYKGLQTGVQKASIIRVDEIREDLPWVDDVMNPLKAFVVPCHPSDIFNRWENEKTVEKLRNESNDKLPPQNLENGPEGLLKDLTDNGIIQILYDGRVQMPDVYRIGFGLGRRGGVRPVR